MGFDLITSFSRTLLDSIDEDGLYPHQCIYIKDDDQCVFEALDLEYHQVLLHVYELRLKNVQQLMFSVDREAKPNQGTEFNDVITCAYWRRDMDSLLLLDGEWHIGVINYQPEPRIVRPIDWHNEFWQEQMMKEINSLDKKFEGMAQDLESFQAHVYSQSQASVPLSPNSERPSDITSDELFEWQNGFHQSEEVPPHVRAAPDLEKFFEELWISGCWLRRELKKLGLFEGQVEKAGMVAGQRTFLSDPWVAAKEVLEKCRRGEFEEPGEELAEKITQEQLADGVIYKEGNAIKFRVDGS